MVNNLFSVRGFFLSFVVLIIRKKFFYLWFIGYKLLDWGFCVFSLSWIKFSKIFVIYKGVKLLVLD